MNKEVIINLNGKKVTGPTDPKKSTCAFLVKNGRTLIINGEGMVDGGSGSYDNNAISIEGGNVIINGGTFTVGRDINGRANSCIYIRKEGGTLIINDGSFYAPKSIITKNGHDWYQVINVYNALRSSKFSVKINGGIFYGYNPTEGDDAKNMSFVSSDCKVIVDGEYTDSEGNKMPIYKVVKK